MSQFPRIVLTDISVVWDNHANGAQRSTFVRKGTVVDVVPGSLLEQEYGAENLSGVIPPGDWRRSDYSASVFSRAAQAN